MRGLVGGLTAIVVTLIAMTGTAHAGAVSFVVDEPSDFGPGFTALLYTGLPGEQNRVTVTTNDAADTVTIRDQGALLIIPDLTRPTSLPGTILNCKFNLNTVTCKRDGLDLISTTVMLGDGNDRATARGDDAVVIDGGTGNDTLSMLEVAGSPFAALVGGGGDDVLRGGPEDDQLFGGHGSDDIAGGGGTDSVYHANRFMGVTCECWDADDATAGVAVSLDDAANDGQPGEGDNVRSDIERVIGTTFDDKLVGSNGPDVLMAIHGNDVIDGRGGDDQLFGLDGDDVITGGSGKDHVKGGEQSPEHPTPPTDNDRLELRDGEPDTYGCAGGTDVAVVDAIDVFHSVVGPVAPNDCEDVQVG